MALNEYRTLHCQEPVSCAILESLHQVYQEIDLIKSQTIGSFDVMMVACGQACCVIEFLSTDDSIDESISSMDGENVLIIFGIYLNLHFYHADEVASLKLLEQLHQDMQEFIFNGTTVVLPELIRLFECSDKSVLQLHEELEILCIDINLTKVQNQILLLLANLT